MAMSAIESIPIIASVVAIIVSITATAAAVVRDRRKPELDSAQATNAIVNSDSVKQQIRRMSDESNARRDLRILDLEEWADLMRPWASSVQESYSMLAEIVRDELWGRGKKEIPDGVPNALPPPPKFPPPRPL